MTKRLLNRLAARDILLVHDGHAARDKNGRATVLDVLPAVAQAAHDAQLHWTTLRAAMLVRSEAPATPTMSAVPNQDAHANRYQD